jgi:large subunit ribosomal protein L3
MTGHLGDAKRTTQNLVIVRIDAERQLLLIRGAVPGSKNGDVTVYPAVRTRRAGAKPAGKPGAAKAGK